MWWNENAEGAIGRPLRDARTAASYVWVRRSENSARFGTQKPGTTRNRVLLAIKCRRRNCRSGGQSSKRSRAPTLNAPDGQPSRAAHSPLGNSAACRRIAPEGLRNPRYQVVVRLHEAALGRPLHGVPNRAHPKPPQNTALQPLHHGEDPR